MSQGTQCILAAMTRNDSTEIDSRSELRYNPGIIWALDYEDWSLIYVSQKGNFIRDRVRSNGLVHRRLTARPKTAAQ